MNHPKLTKQSSRIESVIREAGAVAIASQFRLKQATKDDGSLVTNGDFAVSKFLRKQFAGLFPTYSFFSEESANELPIQGDVIVVDPIDGTESYSRGQDSWAILVCFLKDYSPVLSFVYQPSTMLLYSASRGQGAYLTTANRGVLKLTAKVVGPLKGICSPADFGESDFLRKLGVESIERSFTASLKIMEVAKGKADFYANFRRKCSIWDLLAPSLILEEAGGKIHFSSGGLRVDFQNTWINQSFCAVSARSKRRRLELDERHCVRPGKRLKYQEAPERVCLKIPEDVRDIFEWIKNNDPTFAAKDSKIAAYLMELGGEYYYRRGLETLKTQNEAADDH